MKFLLFVLAFFAVAVACIAAMPEADCSIELGLQCAGAIAKCFDQCKAFVQNPSACFDCLGTNVGTCCPCIQAAFPGISC